jgi:hypothetical protein
MNGLDQAREIAPEGTHFIIGESCCYDPRRNVIILTTKAAGGTDRWSRMKAAHEAVHAIQNQQWPWAMRWPWSWCVPVRILLELGAWREAWMAVAGPSARSRGESEDSGH